MLPLQAITVIVSFESKLIEMWTLSAPLSTIVFSFPLIILQHVSSAFKIKVLGSCCLTTSNSWREIAIIEEFVGETSFLGGTLQESLDCLATQSAVINVMLTWPHWTEFLDESGHEPSN